MTAKQFYRQFLDEISVPLEEIVSARAVRDDLASTARAVLRELGLSGVGFFPTGALAMGTQIVPLHDVDEVVHADDVLTEWVDEPRLALEDLCRDLGARLNGRCETSAHAVKVTLPDERYTADIVFACTREGGGLLIPHCPDDEPHCWLPTHPRRHAELVRERNRRIGTEFARLIRILKALNHRWALESENRRGAVSSWHLTALALALVTKPFSYERAIPAFLEAAADRVLSPLPDPSKVGADLEADEPQRASALMRKAAADTRDALEAGEQAAAVLRGVFGDPQLALAMANGRSLAIGAGGVITTGAGIRSVPAARAYGDGD